MRRLDTLLLLLAAGCLAPTACSRPAPAPSPPAAAEPAPPDRFARDLPTKGGHYRVSIRSLSLPIPLRRLHAWVVHVELADGTPVASGRLEVGGGMPDHGHGFPSAPAITGSLGAGDYRLDGVKFNMTGLWQLDVVIDGPAGRDDVTFFLDIVDLAGGARPRDADTALLAALALPALPPAPVDPSNRVSGDPAAAALGHALFHDRGLGKRDIGCVSCHEPERYFTDGLPRARGLAEVARHAPTLIGVAWQSWFHWDGRRDSLWSHALTPMESAAEMGVTRTEVVRHVTTHPDHGPAYRALFGALPTLPGGAAGPFGDPAARAAWRALSAADRTAIDTAFANVGKALGAFQRTLVPSESRFDRYIARLLGHGAEAARPLLTDDERAGLALFVDDDRTQCLRCHNGPLLTNHGFHDIGTGSTRQPPYDFGRSIGLKAARIDPFNCTGPYSDATPADCRELAFAEREHGAAAGGAFKVPTLRNVAATAPYMHDGRFATLDEVIAWYRDPPPPEVSRHELARTELTEAEARQLVAFLGTLTGKSPVPTSSRR